MQVISANLAIDFLLSFQGRIRWFALLAVEDLFCFFSRVSLKIGLERKFSPDLDSRLSLDAARAVAGCLVALNFILWIDSMDARIFVWSLTIVLGSVGTGWSQVVPAGHPATARRFVVETPHFRVFASDASLAQEVGQMAESYRRHLALHWLGRELAPWMEKVPLTVQSAPNMPASGETKYTLMGGTVRDFRMVVCGSRQRILDSVLPHEMTHTILATHFAAAGKPIPRWADEGACTTVEDESERSKHDTMLVRFLSEGRGIPFASLFAMRDYPRDMMPLYAQGYSLCAFLIAQGGPRQFIQFLERGMQDEDWVTAISQTYGYPKLGKLQTAWNQWVSDGGGTVANYTAVALGYTSSSSASLASATLPAPASSSNNSITALPAQSPPLASVVAAAPPLAPSPQMSTTGKSFYQELFQKHGTPIHVSQPGPMQTMGGTLYR
jgi:hypothetical protein